MQIQYRQNKNILSIMLKICLTYCFAVIIFTNPVFAQKTEATLNTGAVATDGTKSCEPSGDDRKKMAEKANQHLIEMKKQYDLYEQKLQKINKNNLVCYSPSALDHNAGDKSSWSGKTWQVIKASINTIDDVTKALKTYVNTAANGAINDGISGINKTFGTNFSAISGANLAFNNHDVKGASIAEKYVPAIKNSFEAVNNRLSDTQLNIQEIQQNVGKAKSDYATSSLTLKNELNSTKDAARASEIKEQLDVLDKKIKILSECQSVFNDLRIPRDKMKVNRESAHTYLTTLSGEAESQCTCNAKTNELLSCTVTDDTFEQDDVNDALCKNLNEYIAELTTCPTCKIFETILIADQDLASGAFDKLSKGLIKLLMTAFLIFLAYQVLMLVGSPAKQGIGKFLNTVLLQGFKVAVACVLLETPSYLYENGLTPILESGFEFGLSLLADDTNSVINKYAEKYSSFNQENELLTADFLKRMMGAVEGFNEQAAKFPAIGRSLYCNSWQNRIWDIIPHWEMMFEGMLIYSFGLMILLAVGFYLLDIAIHLGVICCLMPFLIACWPFKLTAGYTGVGWKMLLNVFFRFVMIGVLLATVVELLKAAIDSGINENDLEEWLNTNNTEALTKAMNISGLQMLILIICCMISMKLVRSLSDVTNRYAPGGVPTGDMGSHLGGVAASASTSVVKPASKKLGGIAGKAAGQMAEASGVKGAAQAVGGKIKGGLQKAGGAIGIGSKAKIAGGRDNSGGGNSSPTNSPNGNGNGGSNGNGNGNGNGSGNGNGGSNGNSPTP